jgi:anti-sigma regulatory factor (Ser/Thr protein kinase)
VIHAGIVYDDDERLAAQVAGFLEEGFDLGEAAVVVAGDRRWALLGDALGAAASEVDHADRDSFYTRPEAAVAGYDKRVRQALRDGATSVRVFGDVPPPRSSEEAGAWIAYEAILNRVFAGRPVSMLCGYDKREQPGRLLDAVWQTHPRMFGSGDDNDRYRDPAEIVRHNAPATHPPLALRAMQPGDDPVALRRRLRREFDAGGVAPRVADGLVLAVGEVLANADRHGGGVSRMRIGRVGDRFVCEISDRGPGIDDPLAGYIPPGAGAGSGLWVARQLTDRLDLVSTGSGLTARLWVPAVSS